MKKKNTFQQEENIPFGLSSFEQVMFGPVCFLGFIKLEKKTGGLSEIRRSLVLRVLSRT